MSMESAVRAYSMTWTIGGCKPSNLSPRYNIGKYQAKCSLFSSKTRPLTLTIMIYGLMKSIPCNVYAKLYNEDPAKSLEVKASEKLSRGSSNVSVDFGIRTEEFIPENGWVIDGSVRVEMEIAFGREVEDAPAGKACTEYVGLLNQGATCYMNSMLQALFHIPAFRSIVFRMPTTGEEDVSTSIPLCLQRLFYKLQLAKGPCSTKALTTSFGWTRRATMMQHDAQELSRVLIDNLEGKLRNTEMRDDIANLFRGRTKTIFRCKNVEYETAKFDDYYDLTLQVKGCANLNESFRRYIMDSYIDSFMYDADVYGKQEAMRSMSFVSFPDVLQLHLNRLDFDLKTGRPVKVNDRFEFPPVLDLSEYETGGKTNIYELFSVLVHSGGTGGGHYTACLRTTKEPRWFRFNDSIVTEIGEEEAIAGNYGGQKRPSSAYLLIYVRQSEIDRIYAPVEFVPEHLQRYGEMADVIEATMVKLRVFDEQTLKANALRAQKCFAKPQFIAELEVTELMTLTEMYAKVAEATGVQNTMFRLWKTNGSCAVVAKSEKTTLQTFRRNLGELHLFLQKKPGTEKILLPDMKPMTLVAVKFFFPDLKHPFKYIDSFCVSLTWNVRDIIPRLLEKLEFAPGVPLLCYLEEERQRAEEVDIDQTFAHEHIVCGKTLIFQVKPGLSIPSSPFNVEEEVAEDQTTRQGAAAKASNLERYDAFDLLPNMRTGTVDAYMAEHFNRIETTVFDYENQTAPEFKLSLPSCLSYDNLISVFAAILGDRFRKEKDTLFLFSHDTATDSPSVTPILNRDSVHMNVNQKQYYLIIPGITESELKGMSLYRLQISLDGYNVDFDDCVLTPKKGTIKDLLQQVAERGVCKVPLDAKLKCWKTYGAIYHQEFGIDQKIENMYSQFRVDVVPPSLESEKLIQVCTCSINQWGEVTFRGHAFWLAVIDGETVADCMKRINELVKLPAQPIALQLHQAYSRRLKDGSLNDDDVLSEKMQAADMLLLVLEKANPTAKQYRREEAIKIYN